MIISASYKTDIPTFYGEWFMNRLRAGYCKMVNAWNRNQTIRVSLARKDVDGFIFWTKNIGPFVDHLSEIADGGYAMPQTGTPQFLAIQDCFDNSIKLVTSQLPSVRQSLGQFPNDTFSVLCL